MARKEFYRADLQIVIRQQDDGTILIRAGSPLRWYEGVVPAYRAREWFQSGSPEVVPKLPPSLLLGRAIEEWQTRVKASGPPRGVGGSFIRLERVTLDIEDSELAALAWERSLDPFIPATQRVRVSNVRPRAASLLLTLPLRILQVNPAPARDIAATVRQVFGSRADSEVAQAVRAESVLWASDSPWQVPTDWPTVEVLHFDWLPTLALPEERRLMSTAAPEQPGTLGWFARWTGIWQTRLVLIRCNGLAEILRARKLATALTGRGGPAVVLEGDWSADGEDGFHFFDFFYDKLIHDNPLDYILKNFFQRTFPLAPFWSHCLFAGGGREDGLRSSGIGQNLVQLAEVLSDRRTAEARRQEGDLSELIGRQPDIKVEKARMAVRNTLGELRRKWQDYQFDFHEGEGLLPLSAKLSLMRSVMNLTIPAAGIRTYVSTGIRQKEPKKTPPGRYLNSSFWAEMSDGSLEQIDQSQARLSVSEVYHFGIQIGPKDVHIYTAGARAIFEEVFKWTPELEGVWVEIGVTGLDFEVLGDPVQELWLPREGASETVYFAVVPKAEGVARLRFCLYYRQNLIQSFRLASVTLAPGQMPPPATLRQAMLARALDLPIKKVKDVGYLPRLEYSLTVGADNIASLPRRALSLLVNDLDGESFITVKGPDAFGVRTNRNLPDLVSDIRSALQEVSTPPLAGLGRESWPYGFGLPGRPNAGDEQRLKAALTKLAVLGWQLFDGIFPQQRRAEIEKALAPERQVIHVAHVLLEKVIPWAVVYDRFYDPDKQFDDGGNPVAFDVCLVGLPQPDGTLPAQKCGETPSCLLHPDHLRQRRVLGLPVLLPETVVCPLHFWGFKHIVEVPPQQVQGTGNSPQPLQDRILVEGSTQVAAAVNAKLDLAEQHISELEALSSSFPTKWCAKEYRRDPVLKQLKNTKLDFIYFYCHARGGIADPTVRPPYLEVQAKDDPRPGLIKPNQLSHDEEWEHHPLVFLNGCGTVGYSPDALSPFIEKLVTDRGAAGVIGTEIPVWEALATEFAKLFLRSFLNGASAGEALLQARRALLAESNPLGLVYALYAVAELSLTLAGNDRRTRPN